MTHPYQSKTAVLTSKHQKLELIGAPLREAVGLKLIEEALDTDQLGTFSGEIERLGTPLETAIKKARLGMDATGLTLGVASEGSIGPDPLIPFVVSNIETIVFLDSELDIVIAETIRSVDIAAARLSVTVGQDLDAFLTKLDFPRQRVIVKGAGGMEKGIDSREELDNAILRLSPEGQNGEVLIEPDYRAMHSPTRRANIQQAAEALAVRLSSLCPSCSAPGWGKKDYVRGLLCRDCGMSNPDAISRELQRCVRCDFVEPGKVIAESLDPAKCLNCNP